LKSASSRKAESRLSSGPSWLAPLQRSAGPSAWARSVTLSKCGRASNAFMPDACPRRSFFGRPRLDRGGRAASEQAIFQSGPIYRVSCSLSLRPSLLSDEEQAAGFLQQVCEQQDTESHRYMAKEDGLCPVGKTLASMFVPRAASRPSSPLLRSPSARGMDGLDQISCLPSVT
jgi:hypothetical protein